MFSSFSLISLYKRFGSLLCSIFFVLWLCKKQKTKKRLFEQDGYKTFGEKMLVVSCCKFVTSQALMTGNIFMRGIWTTWKVLELFTKMHFSKFCGIFKDGTKMKRKPEGDSKKEKRKKNINHINSRVFLAIKSLTQPWAFESEWNNYMNKCVKMRSLSLLTVF